MNKEVITLQPEQLQFGEESKQLIKVTNRTQDTLDNCFFCMFNTAKYQFSPESFSLEPQEQKLITVTLKLAVGQSYMKQFAYLKTKNINKRIIIHNNPSDFSDEKLRSPQSGVEDLHTLSSRDYRSTQKTAYEKVIAEKEAYIKRLERKIEEQDDSVKKTKGYGTGEKSKNFYINEIEELEIKIDLINQEKEQLTRDNILMQQRFNQYKDRQNNDTRYDQASDKLAEQQELIDKQIDEIHFLEAQCEDFLKKISEKETKIREVEEANKRVIFQLTNQSDERLRALEKKIQQQKSQADECSRVYEEKIKMLEISVSESQVIKTKVSEYEKQIEKKKKDLERVAKKLEDEESKKKQYEEERKKLMKLQLENNSLEEKNQYLSSRVREMEKSIDELRQQTIIYKSKIVDQDSSTEKVGHYMEVALESCRNENQILKKSKCELEHSFAQQVKKRKTYEEKVDSMKQQIKHLKNQIEDLMTQKQEFQNRHRLSKQDSHETIMKLKSENIDLIEKINLGPKKDELAESKIKISRVEEELGISRKNQQQLASKLKESEGYKEKLIKRVEKYKKEAKKELKSIEDNVLDQLKRVKGQKKKLTKKVEELEQSVHSQTFDQTRNKTKTHYDAVTAGPNHNIKTRCPMSQQGEKRTGIKDQRKELEESHVNSRLGVDLEGLYCELGQLRQYRNYVNKELSKYSKNKGLGETGNLQQNRNLIFQAINFFKQLQSKENERNPEESKISEAVKQIEFLKGRLAELQILKKEGGKNYAENMSSIDLARPEHDKTLLEYVRQEMKSQYKKLYDALKLNEDKYEILKKKIYEEYRSRLIDLMAKKDRDERTVNKIQATLERFIDGLANLSHKQAVLAKQIKLKQAARKEAGGLREKVNYLNNILQNKKGACTRDPVKVFKCENENEWYDNIRLEAQLLTFEAENARLLEEVALSQEHSRNLEEELKCCISDLEQREQDIIRLKKEVIKIDRQRELQAEKSKTDIENLQKKFSGFQNMESEMEQLAHREKQYNSLKDDLQRKKQLIKSLKEKEKMLEQLLESTNRTNSENRDRDRKDHTSEVRMHESLRDLKDGNRQLRSENIRLKETIQNLEEELHKKNAALKRMKTEGEEHRIKAAKGEVDDVQKLRNQVRDLKDELRKGKQQFDKMKKKKDKQIQQLESQLKKTKNEVLIEKRSLESIIRALIDTIRRIYCSLDIIVRKKGLKSRQCPNFEQLLSSPGEIDSLKVYESFESVIESLKQSML